MTKTTPNHRNGGNGERILVVDDSRETVRHLAETLLPMFGFRSTYALDGRTALEKIRTEKPDLVMLDLNLPNMTGIDVLQTLVLEPNCPPVVLMTGGGSEQRAVEAFRLGVKDYLVKPFTMDEVLETIKRTLKANKVSQANSAETTPDTDQLNVAHNEIRRQKEQFDTLLAISKSLTSLNDVNIIIDQALRIALEQCGAEQSILWLPDEDRTQMRTYQFKLDKNGVYTHNTPIQDRYMQRVLDSGTLLRETSFSDGLNVGLDRQARSILYVPIKIHNETVGVLGVSHVYAPHSFSEMDELFLEAIGSYASIAVANAFAVQKSRNSSANRMRDMTNIINIVNGLTAESADKAIRDALFLIYNKWHIEACSVWCVNQATQGIRFLTNMGVGADELIDVELPLGEGFVGYVAETGKWIYSNAVLHHPRHHSGVDEKTGFETRSILCVPLTYQGEVLGALQLLNPLDGGFSERDVDQAMNVGSVLSLALYLRRTEMVAG
ncbi:MAG TPA: response regulator [Anaerolineae bacterium]|nr:response regulator [Anaerolineae bacterium]